MYYGPVSDTFRITTSKMANKIAGEHRSKSCKWILFADYGAVAILARGSQYLSRWFICKFNVNLTDFWESSRECLTKHVHRRWLQPFFISATSRTILSMPHLSVALHLNTTAGTNGFLCLQMFFGDETESLRPEQNTTRSFTWLFNSITDLSI